MNPTYFIFFLAILMGTLAISYWSAKRGTSTDQFYTAAGRLTGFQNGLAIAGDFVSAASFLGITGTIALRGFDGFLYSIGFLVSYLLLLFIAEPIHHLGKFTLGDVIFSRFPSNFIRVLLSINTVVISIFYMVPQLVAAGLLVHFLLGIDYTISVLTTGTLMTIYVIFGGMVSTSWIQIVKTVLLLFGTFLIALIVLSRFHWSLLFLFESAIKATPYKENFLNPGNLFKDPLDALSLSISLVLGTAGLPHILNRFFTVKDAITVRRSILSATWIIGIFYLLILILGMGVVNLVGWNRLLSIDPSGDLAAPLLGASVGGDFFMAFISAVAFATILAVVTGLLLSATTSLSHDVYHHLIKRGISSEKDQLLVAKFGAAGVGVVAVLLSLGMQHMNAVFPVSLTFVLAASTNLPLILFTLYWKRFNSIGAICGILTGFISSLFLAIWEPYLLPLHDVNPGLFTIPLGFLGGIVGTYATKREIDEESFIRIVIQSQTGYKTN